MPSRTEQHRINSRGKALLRQRLEQFGWVLNELTEDYGLDFEVQVFQGNVATGVHFKVQLKSSLETSYSADGSFVSQRLDDEDLKHLAVLLRDPVMLVHADVQSETVFWYAPQLDSNLVEASKASSAKSMTVRIPTRNKLPDTADELITQLERIYTTLALRTISSTEERQFRRAATDYGPSAHEALQDRNDVLKLLRVGEAFKSGDYSKAKARASSVMNDPDASLERRFWAAYQLGNAEWAEAHVTGRIQSDLPKIKLQAAERLKHLAEGSSSRYRLFALVEERAARLDSSTRRYHGLSLAWTQHSRFPNNLIMLVNLRVQRAECARAILKSYNQCLRLTKVALSSRDSMFLATSLTDIVMAAAGFLPSLERTDQRLLKQFQSSLLQIAQAVAKVGLESGESSLLLSGVSAALITIRSEYSEAFQWVEQVKSKITSTELIEEIESLIQRNRARWKGETVAGDVKGDVHLQIAQNLAASVGLDPSDESNPIMRTLINAVRDSDPTPILQSCGYLLATLGAVGPSARRVQFLFNVDTGGRKILHCVKHDFHIEDRTLSDAFSTFNDLHCRTCPDRRPRPLGWKFEGEERKRIERENLEFAERYQRTGKGFRFTAED